MRQLAAALALALLTITAATAEESRPLTEIDALRLERLILHQQLLTQRHRAEVAEAQVEWGRRATEVTTFVGEAAARAGLDPKMWQPDPIARVWRKAP